MNELLAVNSDIADAAGAIVYWRLSGAIELDALEDAWTGAGLDKKLLPRPTTPDRALFRALSELAGPRILCRPLERKKRGYAIVRETANADSTLSYETLLQAWIDTDSNGTATLRVDAANYPDTTIAKTTLRKYAAFCGELSTGEIADWIAQRVLPSVKAVGLRDRGGIYFVPANTVDEWRSMVDVVRSVSEHRIFEIPAMRSDEAVQAILDAITGEAEEAAAEMEADLTGADATDAGGGLGIRSIRHRERRCEALLSKLDTYQELLGIRMDNMHKRIAELQAGLAAAALSAKGEE